MSKHPTIQQTFEEGTAVGLRLSPPESTGNAARRKWADAAQITALLFVLLLGLLHFIDRGLDPSWRFISEYALGPAGWMMSLAFLSLAVSSLSVFMVIRTEQSGIGYRIGLGMLLISAAGLVLGALFVTDPIDVPPSEASTLGLLHNLGATLGIAGPIATAIISWRLPKAARWAGARTAIRWSGAIAVLASVVAAVSIPVMLANNGGVFGPETPVGWTNRVEVVAGAAWLFVVALMAGRVAPLDGPRGKDRSADSSSVLSSDGTRIAFESIGQGPTVILVGAALADRSDARRLARHLSDRFTVINYDRRGRGQSGAGKTRSVQAEIDDIDALVDWAGGSASLFGSSSGGVLALDAAQHLGDKIESLVLYEPPFIVDGDRPPLDESFGPRIRDLLDQARPGDAVRSFFADGMGIPRAMLALMRVMPGWKKMVKMADTLRYDLAVLEGTQAGGPLPASRWTGIRSPLVVIVGEKSEDWFRTGAEALTRQVSAAEVRALPKASHAAVVATPGRLAAAITDSFIRDGNRKGGRAVGEDADQ